jgi:hypothetical protein
MQNILTCAKPRDILEARKARGIEPMERPGVGGVRALLPHPEARDPEGGPSQHREKAIAMDARRLSVKRAHTFLRESPPWRLMKKSDRAAWCAFWSAIVYRASRRIQSFK